MRTFLGARARRVTAARGVLGCVALSWRRLGWRTRRRTGSFGSRERYLVFSPARPERRAARPKKRARRRGGWSAATRAAIASAVRYWGAGAHKLACLRRQQLRGAPQTGSTKGEFGGLSGTSLRREHSSTHPLTRGRTFGRFLVAPRRRLGPSTKRVGAAGAAGVGVGSQRPRSCRSPTSSTCIHNSRPLGQPSTPHEQQAPWPPST